MKNTEELIRQAQAGDKMASEQLIKENTGLIWSVAKRFLGRGTEADDLYQLGCVGFLKAIAGFDAAYGTQFSTYAVPKIGGEIRRYLRDNGAVKVSRTMKEQASMIKKARKQFIDQCNREPTLSELSEKTGLSAEEIAAAETATAQTESIYQEYGEDGFCLEDILTDGNMENELVEKIALREAISQLNEREQSVIRLRFFHSLTQDKVAQLIGVSQVQVSRIEKRAVCSLRANLTKAEP